MLHKLGSLELKGKNVEPKSEQDGHKNEKNGAKEHKKY
jgi:hypothetical protein